MYMYVQVFISKRSAVVAMILGSHGSDFLCRVERENKMAATYNVLAFKRCYFAW